MNYPLSLKLQRRLWIMDWVAGVPSTEFRVPNIENNSTPNTQNHPRAPRPAHRFVNK